MLLLPTVILQLPSIELELNIFQGKHVRFGLRLNSYFKLLSFEHSDRITGLPTKFETLITTL